MLSVPSSSGHRFQLKRPSRAAMPLLFFQSPLHRGTGFNSLSSAQRARSVSLSVPSSSGHRFQPLPPVAPPAARGSFQSPLHRGTGFNMSFSVGIGFPPVLSVPSSSGHRFQHFTVPTTSLRISFFQSPLHRGTGFNKESLARLRSLPQAFSPLFIGAQVSTWKGCTGLLDTTRTFSPLFIGAQVSTGKAVRACWIQRGLSVPSSSGHRFQPARSPGLPTSSYSFQSPLHRGTGFNASARCNCNWLIVCFQSPLHRGTGFNIHRSPAQSPGPLIFQSPLHRGTGFNFMSFTELNQSTNFQSPLHRGTGFNHSCAAMQRISSIPFSPLFIGAQVSTPHSKGGMAP